MQNVFVSREPIGPQLPTQDLNLRLICNDCKDPVPNIVEDFSQGDLICGSCGLVLGNRIIDTRSEWRTFANSDDNSGDPSRIGAAADPLLGGINILESTTIGQRDGGNGSAFQLNKAHSKIGGVKTEKQLVNAFKDIQTMGDRIGLSKIVIDSAKQLYKQVEDEKLLKGRPQEAVQAACIYIGCQEHHVSRTFKEITALTKVAKKEIARCYKAIRPLFQKPVQQINLDSLISRFSNFLDLSTEVRKGSLLLAKRTMDVGTLAGKSPISLVAACLFFVSSLSDSPKSAKEIAQRADCTEGTLKNAYRLLYEAREELMSDLPDFKSAKPIESLPTP